MAFKVNDLVTWTSQANGSQLTKTGRIIAVVPTRTTPYKLLSPEILDQYNCAAVDARSLFRKEESYLVAVETGGKAKPKLYWPRVSALRPAPPAKEENQ